MIECTIRGKHNQEPRFFFWSFYQKIYKVLKSYTCKKIQYEFEKCDHDLISNEFDLLCTLKHLKDFHLNDFNHVCNVNQVYGLGRFCLMNQLDKRKQILYKETC